MNSIRVICICAAVLELVTFCGFSSYAVHAARDGLGYLAEIAAAVLVLCGAVLGYGFRLITEDNE